MSDNGAFYSKLLYKRFIHLLLVCLLIFSVFPHSNLSLAKEENGLNWLKITGEESRSIGEVIKLEVDTSSLEVDAVSIFIPDGLEWVKEENQALTYNSSSTELILENTHTAHSLSLRAIDAGTFTIKAVASKKDSASFHTSLDIAVMPAETDMKEEEPSEEKSDSSVETDDVEKGEETDQATEEVEASPPLQEEQHKELEDSPPLQEEQNEELEDSPPLQEEQEEQEENSSPSQKDQTADETKTEETDAATDSEKVEEPSLVEHADVELRSTIETANVASIPAPPVSGPNVADLFAFSGDQVRQHSSSNVRVLADGTTNKRSAMWFKQKVDLSRPFTTSMHLYINSSSPDKSQIADGLTFTMHNDSNGANAIGQGGESLGAYGTIRNNSSYGGFIRNAVSFEFDTYFNGDYSDRSLTNANHTAVVIPSGTTREGNRYRMNHQHVNYYRGANSIVSSNWQPFTVNWTPKNNRSGTLTYTFRGNTTSYEISDYSQTFGSSNVHWGFTGSTGQQDGMYAIAYANLPQQPQAGKQVRNVTAGETAFKTNTNAYPGDTLEYKLTLSNPADNGLGTVWTNVKATDTLPAGISYVESGTDNKPTRVNGQTLEFNVGNINQSQSRTLIFRVKVNDNASPILVNQAYAEAQSGAFLGRVFTNDSTVSLNQINVNADPVAQTFPRITDTSKWDPAAFVKNMHITPRSLKQDTKVLGFSGALPDTNVPGTYTVNVKIASTIYPGIERTIQVPVTITDGSLSFVAPNLDFGTQTISSKPEQYFGEVGQGELSIIDTRHLRSTWALSVKLSSPFVDTESNEPLSAEMIYMSDGTEKLITPQDVQIATGRNELEGRFLLSEKWSNIDKSGFFLQVSPGSAKVNQTYQAKMTWTLQDVPGNE
ncbi:putative repeat protein (TIGR01451 family) [Alkalihalobacillus xiaoxiensis]|uniref:Repeat protein (TIGR01451 family) n=1 Tax=Shouchella xiaoxiensis TaxID=766895 RepID=A0ABS2SYX0_9BACI|nr:WxL domain-containing protein [Shouchella xiaoxiensis]MBM7840727.1 putative repeat protein (TIGR01451 family) [Shouchella xiaoxiensis]